MLNKTLIDMKFTLEQRIVLRNNIEKHGNKSVRIKMIEESSELIQILAKNELETLDCINKIVDEIADNYVVLEQLKMIYGESYIQDRIDFKIDRLDKRNNTNTI